MLRIEAQGRTISNFALTHFNAAIHFANKANEIETANTDQPLGNFFNEISIYCSSCIISSAASIEALINQLYLTPGPLHNSIDNFDTFFWGGTNKETYFWFFRRSKRKKDGLERKPALEKYKKAINLLGKPPLRRDEDVYRYAESLIGFRNYLIHFKPLWDDVRRNKTLEESLRGLFKTSPYVDTGADFLATQCMSAGCATWSVNTARVLFLTLAIDQKYILIYLQLFDKKKISIKPNLLTRKNITMRLTK